jgi:Na+/melibiose symporter-like transporter
MGLLSRRTTLFYAAGSIGTGAFYAFNNFVLPPVLKSFGAPDLLIGLLSSTRSLEGAIIQPTVGAYSDRIWTRIGRRAPFILVGIPLSATFFVSAGFVDSLAGLALTIFLFSFFFNLAVDPYTALLADIAPLEHRGWLSGLATGVQLVSSVLFLVLMFLGVGAATSVPTWTYFVVAGVLIVSFGTTVLGVREPEQRDEKSERLPLRAYVDLLLQQRQALNYLITLFIYQFGLNAIVPYLVLFIEDEIHESQQVAFGLSAGLLVVTALGALVFGLLADRVGTRRVLVLGWGLLAVSAVAGVFVTTLSQTIWVVVVAGLGNGAATAVSWPLLSALIPPEKTGVFAGLKAAAESIAIPLSIVVAAEVFLPRFGYHGIFAMLAINIVLALVVLLRFVKVPRAAEPSL